MNIKKIMTDTYQFICMVMVMIFSLLPAMAIIGPKKYGSYFYLFEKIEIYTLFLCIIAYAFYKTYSLCTKSESDSSAVKGRKSVKYLLSNFHLVLFFIMFVFVVISVLRFPDNTRVIKGRIGRPDGILMYMCFFALFIFAFSLRNPYLKKYVLGTYIFSFILVSVIMLLQYYGMIGSAHQTLCPDWGWTKGLQRYFAKTGIQMGVFYRGETGSFFNLNHMGYYIALCSCLFTGKLFISKNRTEKILYGILCGFSYWVLIVNNTLGAFIAVVFTLGIFTLYNMYRMAKSFSHSDKNTSRKIVLCVIGAMLLLFIICFLLIYIAVNIHNGVSILPLILSAIFIIGSIVASVYCIIKIFPAVIIGKILTILLPLMIFTGVCGAVSNIPFEPKGPIIANNFVNLKKDGEKIANSSEGYDKAGSGRLKLWIASVHLIKEKPLLGFGPDNVKDAYTKENVSMDRCHCEPLEIAVSVGIPAALCYVGAIAFIIIKNMRKKNLSDNTKTNNCLPATMAVCAYFISGLVGVFLFYTACHMFIMMGLASGEDEV